jgi:hypothetical protein
LWFDTSTGSTYIYYNSAWVELGGGSMSPMQVTSSTRPSSPWTGQTAYETDTNNLIVWNGTAWVMIADTDTPPGLQLIKTVSFSSSTQADATSCFSSEFDNYRIEIEWLQNTTNGNLQIKLRDSGGLISSNYGFTSGGSYYSSGTGTFAGFNNSANESETFGYISGCVAAYRGSASYDVFGANLSRETNLVGQVAVSNASATLTRLNLTSAIRHNSATVCTGFSLIPSAGSITGTVSVYGYRK